MRLFLPITLLVLVSVTSVNSNEFAQKCSSVAYSCFNKQRTALAEVERQIDLGEDVEGFGSFAET